MHLDILSGSFHGYIVVEYLIVLGHR